MSSKEEMLRQQLLELLGDLPDMSAAVQSTSVAMEEHDHYILEKLVLDLNGIEPVPAYFVRLKEVHGPLPTVLYNHAHGGNYVLGKDELVDGRAGQQRPPYGEALTRAGYAVLCIDTWAFGERRGRCGNGRRFRTASSWEDGDEESGEMVAGAVRGARGNGVYCTTGF